MTAGVLTDPDRADPRMDRILADAGLREAMKARWCWAGLGGDGCTTVVASEDELGLCEFHRRDILGGVA